MPTDRDSELVRALVRWFRASARSLPWRESAGGSRDPYRVLVSEVMLQQTQASRVAERFDEFIGRFPTIRTLAAADETEVLAAWSGLGYYRRARMLHAAAREIVVGHDGRFPESAAGLARLPGVGRYTAGAIASLAFGERAAAVDANVSRVVLRLEGRTLPASDPEAVRLAWSRAAELLEAGRRWSAALVNEALIELGALVCLPRNPACERCPLRELCVARATGMEGEIPAARARASRAARYFASVIVRDGKGRLSVTRRPGSGMWAGLYEAPTVERADRAPRPGEVRRALRLTRPPRLLATFPFQTTHRACVFDIYEGEGPAEAPRGWEFRSPESIAGLGLSTPQRRILLEIAAGRGLAQ